MNPILILIILLLLGPILWLIIGKKAAVFIIGMILGYNMINSWGGGLIGGFKNLIFPQPSLAECLTEFSTCTNGQIIGILIIVASFIYLFIPTSKLK